MSAQASLGAAPYVPPWFKKPKTASGPSAPAGPVTSAPAPAEYRPQTNTPTSSAIRVTRTTTNATTPHLNAPPAAAPFGAPRGLPPVTPPRGAVQSPGLSSRSPIVQKRLPTRMSPAVVPRSTHMNPNASEFVPGGAGVRGGPAGGAALEALPTSTADMEAEQRRQTASSPGRRTSQPSPALPQTSLAAKTAAEVLEISQRSALKVGAAAYVPRRTMTRVVLTKPSPLTLVPSTDPNAAETDANTGMMLDDLWSLFYLPTSFGESIKEEDYNPTLVFRIDSIPTFWKVLNNIPCPTEMSLSTLYLFRDGIDPRWEDAANRDGGIVKVKVDSSRVDEAWELLLCRTIGDSWSPTVRNTVNGVALKVRERGYLLEVWVTRQCPELLKDIADLWQPLLGGAFAAVYYSHASLQERAHAAAAAVAGKQKKQKKRF